MLKKIVPLMFAAVLGSAITWAVAYRTLNLDRLNQTSNITTNTVSNPASPLARLTSGMLGASGSPIDFTAAAEATTRSVVHIKSTEGTVKTTAQKPNKRQSNPFDPFGDLFGEDMFPFFFDDPRGGGRQAQPRVGTGSGVIISNDGYIVTNNHVISGADKIEVTLHDQREYEAELVGTDPSTDIALIRIKENNLPALPLANSDDARVGQWVLAVGNPFNLESTVTAGIVSAKGRNINILEDKSAIESFIQTDAAVNPGNSGGALVNTEGQLIGINTAIASQTGSFTGYSFAVPVNIVKKVVDDLLDYGIVQRGYLGVMIRDVNGAISKEKGLNVSQGVYVDSLMADGSGYAAGIKAGDVIVKVDGAAVKSAPELQEMIGRHRPGDVVMVTVNRKGTDRDVRVVLKNKSGTTEVVKKENAKASDVLGADLMTLDNDACKKLGIKGGVKVTNLNSAGKLARYTDMQDGFVITKIGDTPVNKVEDVERLLSGRSGGVLLEGVYPGYPNTYYYGFGM
jgi:serine protease Do